MPRYRLATNIMPSNSPPGHDAAILRRGPNSAERGSFRLPWIAISLGMVSLILSNDKLALHTTASVSLAVVVSVLGILLYRSSNPVWQSACGMMTLTFLVGYVFRAVALLRDENLFYYQEVDLTTVELMAALNSGSAYFAASLAVLSAGIIGFRTGTRSRSIHVHLPRGVLRERITFAMVLISLALPALSAQGLTSPLLTGYAVRLLPLDLFALTLFEPDQWTRSRKVIIVFYLLVAVLSGRRYAFLLILLALLFTTRKKVHKTVQLLFTRRLRAAILAPLIFVPAVFLINLTVDQKFGSASEVGKYSYDINGASVIANDATKRLAAIDQTVLIQRPPRQKTEFSNIRTALETSLSQFIPGVGGEAPSMGRVMAIEYQGFDISSKHSGAWTGPGLSQAYFPGAAVAGLLLGAAGVLGHLLVRRLFSPTEWITIGLFASYKLFWQLPLSGNFDVIVTEFLVQILVGYLIVRLMQRTAKRTP